MPNTLKTVTYSDNGKADERIIRFIDAGFKGDFGTIRSEVEKAIDNQDFAILRRFITLNISALQQVCVLQQSLQISQQESRAYRNLYNAAKRFRDTKMKRQFQADGERQLVEVEYSKERMGEDFIDQMWNPGSSSYENRTKPLQERTER